MLCAATPQFPTPAGGLLGRSPLVLSCPRGQTVSHVAYAKWGRSLMATDGNGSPQSSWFCFGPQPPPPGECAQDVSAVIAPLCVGKAGCNLTSTASDAVLGTPCAAPSGGIEQLIVRIACSGSGGDSVNNNSATVAPAELAAGHAPHVHRRSAPAEWAIVNASVPGGSTGLVHVPLHQQLGNSTVIRESGSVVFRDNQFVHGASMGVEGLRTDGRFATFEVGSGDYSFSALV